ncbi:hypothetical protein DKX38_006152 [Salix brachista]|uniref:Uncharacterized protein n=1 Tax=Salix brachista TaxID=2182728 RepID=A0A5N5N149_9ROSI|nr:hypothetical protein DKX38_006152 [Salix brachista]
MERKKSDLCPCKILKVLEEGTVKTKYEVAWLDRNKKVIETAIVNRSDLIWKKSPLSRNSLKPFIRKSTYRSFPWVLHDKLAEKYQISRDPPQDLEGKVFIQDGIVYNKRKKDATDVEESGKLEKKKVEGEEAEATGKGQQTGICTHTQEREVSVCVITWAEASLRFGVASALSRGQNHLLDLELHLMLLRYHVGRSIICVITWAEASLRFGVAL